jgi:hypothetical protein
VSGGRKTKAFRQKPESADGVLGAGNATLKGCTRVPFHCDTSPCCPWQDALPGAPPLFPARPYGLIEDSRPTTVFLDLVRRVDSRVSVVKSLVFPLQPSLRYLTS